MVRRVAAVLTLVFALLAPPASAEGFLAFTWHGSNDQYGDAEDRWRTATLQTSLLLGPRWTGSAPLQFGELIELRTRQEIFAPSNLTAPRADDRPYAAVASLGLHTHWARGEADLRFGADLVLIGPQTGLDDLQTTLHRAIPGQPSPEPAQRTQLGDTARLALSGEAARDIRLAPRLRLRPFAEARVGDEALARVGADVIFGGIGEGGLLLRDVSTGQLYDGMPGRVRGLSFVGGLDVAAVGDSVYLPDDRGATLSPVRTRARVAAHWQLRRFAIQYGFTWLGPEFDEQPEGQVLGSGSILFRF